MIGRRDRARRGELVVLKLGGAASEDAAELRVLLDELATLIAAGTRVVIVHGGGKELSALTRRFGVEPQFRDGVRMTSAAEMDMVDMVLAGAVNKRLVRACRAAGLRAVGLCGADGAMVCGVRVSADSRTAEVASVDPALLQLLLEGGYLPVVAPPSVEPPQTAVNINADSVALGLAPALGASALLFLSDVAGVLKQERVLAELSPRAAEAEIAIGTISGGMIPKLRAAIRALEQGVARVVIGTFDGPHTLARMMAGALGTTIQAGTGTGTGAGAGHGAGGVGGAQAEPPEAAGGTAASPLPAAAATTSRARGGAGDR